MNWYQLLQSPLESLASLHRKRNVAEMRGKQVWACCHDSQLTNYNLGDLGARLSKIKGESASKIIFLGPAGFSLARSSSAGASISHTLKIRWRRPRPHASPPPNLVPKFSLSLRKTNNRNRSYPWHIKFRPATWPWNSDIGQQKCKLATTTWWWVKNVTATRKIAKY